MNLETIFLKICNLGISAGWLILAVILLRFLLKKAPKNLICVLWGFAALRLCFPFSIESVLSLIPSAQTVPEEILISPAPEIASGISQLNSLVNPVISESLAPIPSAGINPMQTITKIAAVVWLCGVFAMLCYMAGSYFLTRRHVREASPEDGVYLIDHIDSPFIFGVFRPRIYMPSDMSAEDRAYALSHERMHLRRLDHIWKPLGFLILSVYWFFPPIWAAYLFFCRDLEAACDEGVIRAFSKEERASYSHALLHASVKCRLGISPLAFGEVGVKERIRRILNYKKPSFWVTILCIVLCIGVAVFFLTDPIDTDKLKDSVFDPGDGFYHITYAIQEDEPIDWNPYATEDRTDKTQIRSLTFEGFHFVGAHVEATASAGTLVIDNDHIEEDTQYVRPMMTWTPTDLPRKAEITLRVSIDGKRICEGTITLERNLTSSDSAKIGQYKVSIKSEDITLSETSTTDVIHVGIETPQMTSGPDYDPYWYYDTKGQMLHSSYMLPLQFNGEYTQITLETTAGGFQLYSGREVTADAVQSAKDRLGGLPSKVVYRPNSTAAWVPYYNTDGYGANEKAEIRFTLHNGEAVVGKGKILLTQSAKGNQWGRYTVKLESDSHYRSVSPIDYRGLRIQPIPTEAELRAKYPAYFEISDFKGLEIYVSEGMGSPQHYYCYLLPGTNRLKTYEEIYDSERTTVEEMRYILKYRGISGDEVFISILPQPGHSSQLTVLVGRTQEEAVQNYSAMIRAFLEID